MPTCSQAKIITNLETDIQKRLFALTRAGGGTAEGGGGGITQYGDPSGDNLENEENFYETIQNLNSNHQQQQQQQYSPSSSSHQNHINSNNDLSEINKLSSLTANLNVNENFKLYQSFHRPTKTLASPSNTNSVVNNNLQSTNLINTNNNNNTNVTTISNNMTGRKLGLLKNQSSLNNNDSKSINNNVIISNEQIYPTPQKRTLIKPYRRVSVDEIQFTSASTITSNQVPLNSNLCEQHSQIVHKVPIVFGDFNNNQQIANGTKQQLKDGSSVSSTGATYTSATFTNSNIFGLNNNQNNNSGNGLYKHNFSGVNGQMRNPVSSSHMLRGIKILKHVNTNNVGSDGEDLTDEQLSGRSGDQDQIDQVYNNEIEYASTTHKNSRHSLTSPRLLSNRQINTNSIQQQQQQQSILLPRRSIDFASILPLAKSKRNSIDLDASKLFNGYNHHRDINIDSRRNSIGCSIGNTSGGGYFTTFPKIALQVDHNSLPFQSNNLNHKENKLATQSTTNTSNRELLIDNEDMVTNEECLNIERRISINQAKRLLALASIRPSKTFHKTMTQEEIEVLRKYYDIIKPKVSLTSSANNINGVTSNLINQQSELEKEYASQPPIVYDTTKVNLISLHNLKHFIETYKKDIDSGMYTIDYDSLSDPKGFVLKPNQQMNSTLNTIKFPNELNDTFFALAVVTGASSSQSSSSPIGSASLSSIERESSIRLGEANLYRIVNWNDTTVSSLSHHKTKLSPIKRKVSNDEQQQQNATKSLFSSASSSTYSQSISSPTSSTLSFEYIKSLSSLVNSILEPKLLNKLSYTGVDISVLPGGANYDIPSFEELGIDLNTILSSGAVNSGTNSLSNQDSNNVNAAASAAVAAQQQQLLYQSSKLKAAAYKKLKEKVSTSKCMWFSSPPERKPLSVIFESTGLSSDISHEQLLEETNKYLKPIGGHVESLEFVPRSVHFGSVYVDNLWILTLNDMNTKFFTITNGLRINPKDPEDKLTVKSYDEFIFSEYERFIRNEKYKKLIKNHEKAVQQLNNSKLSNSKKNSKKSITTIPTITGETATTAP